ncbi:protein rep [Enterococcus faecium]|uniref:protein rep n=3 Tax=Enterococcus faecium TaxID=1352 RepID=UPI003CC5E145
MDKTKSGKVRPWREKKIANVDYFELLHILEFKKAERVKDCAEILEYKQNRETGERKLYRVWFCKSRLCPMCNWRRAMKHGIQSQKVVAEVIKQKPTVRWLFLTLTVKNVYDGEELNKSLSDMAQGFRRMMQYKKINKNGSVAKF